MDLKKFDLTETPAQKVELTHPATEEVLRGDDGEPIWIEVYGADSDVFRKAMRSYGNKKLQKGSRKQTMEEIEQTAARILASATKSWSDNFVVDGEAVECNQKTAEWLYMEYSWIREQVDAFVNDRSNFLTNA